MKGLLSWVTFLLSQWSRRSKWAIPLRGGFAIACWLRNSVIVSTPLNETTY
jgi:hypothetical protein